MKIIQKLALAGIVIGQLSLALPVFAAPAAPVVTLATITVVGKRAVARVAPAAPGTSALPSAAVRLEATLEPIVIIGHRSTATSDLNLAHAQSAPVLARASAL